MKMCEAVTNEDFCRLIDEAETQTEVDNTVQSMISFINISAELTKRKLLKEH